MRDCKSRMSSSQRKKRMTTKFSRMKKNEFLGTFFYKLYKFAECPLCTRKLQAYADEVASHLDNVQKDLNLTQELSALQTELHATKDHLQKVQVRTSFKVFCFSFRSFSVRQS